MRGSRKTAGEIQNNKSKNMNCFNWHQCVQIILSRERDIITYLISEGPWVRYSAASALPHLSLP